MKKIKKISLVATINTEEQRNLIGGCTIKNGYMYFCENSIYAGEVHYMYATNGNNKPSPCWGTEKLCFPSDHTSSWFALGVNLSN